MNHCILNFFPVVAPLVSQDLRYASPREDLYQFFCNMLCIYCFHCFWIASGIITHHQYVSIPRLFWVVVQQYPSKGLRHYGQGNEGSLASLQP